MLCGGLSKSEFTRFIIEVQSIPISFNILQLIQLHFSSSSSSSSLLGFIGGWPTTVWCITATNWNGVDQDGYIFWPYHQIILN